MSGAKSTNLAAAACGIDLVIVEIDGGRVMVRRFESLGLIPGTVIVKINSQIMRGPVIVKNGSTKLAIGFGMARRILVRPAARPPA